jgi:HPt (histidine-containing phosphotransfer) domain-containing protein
MRYEGSIRGSGPLIDTERLRSLRTECGDEVVTEIVELFARATPQLLDQLRSARSHGDAETLRATAHQLKGSCLAIGASSMASLARDLEHRADPTAAIERLEAALKPTYDALLLVLVSASALTDRPSCTAP